MARSKRAAIGVAALLSAAVSGCSTMERIPYTAAEAAQAQIPGMTDVRFSGDASASVFDKLRRDVVQQAAARHENVSYLALSGGGGDGAFGAGFLKGLTATGRRPQFSIVSGVSTGALMAPFAFLGSDYDPTLQDLYTAGYAAALVKNINVLNGIFGNALVDSDKLGRFIAQYVDDGVMQKVAAEHRKGRRLLIATTNLDAQRSEVWNMGAIANSGAPNALALFRQVLAASASVPGLFPPRLVDVQGDGKAFQEMHVDGGTLRQLYVAPDDVIYAENKTTGGIKDLYILVNNKVDPVFDVVSNSTVGVGARSLATILKREGRNNVMSAYAYASRNRINYHLAYIDPTVPDLPPDRAQEEFSTEYMTYLFQLGEAKGRSARPWNSTPPLTHEPVVQAGPNSKPGAAPLGVIAPVVAATGG